MNVENIKRVRDLIASLPSQRFNMADYARDYTNKRSVHVDELEENCGTAACICGWVNARIEGGNRAILSDHATAAHVLGIDDVAADDLFYANGTIGSWADITQAQAVRVLDHLIATGKVDWSVARAAAPDETAASLSSMNGLFTALGGAA